MQNLEYLENGTKPFYEIKILKLYLRFLILRSYRFVAEVTFKLPQNCYIMNIQL